MLLDWTQDLKIFCFRYQKSHVKYCLLNTYFELVFFQHYLFFLKRKHRNIVWLKVFPQKFNLFHNVCGIMATKLFCLYQIQQTLMMSLLTQTINIDPFSFINLSFWFQVDILALYVLCAPFSSIGPKLWTCMRKDFESFHSAVWDGSLTLSRSLVCQPGVKHQDKDCFV